jgi:hypothetical protein
MESTVDVTLIKDIVDRLDPTIKGQEEHPDYRTAVVLLAAVRVGPVVDKLVALTGYESEFVGHILERMRLAGLWSETKVKIGHWLAEDGDTIKTAVFWADVLVAQGLLMAQPEGPIRVRYWILEDKEDNTSRKPSAGISKPLVH